MVCKDSANREVSVVLPTYNEKENIRPLIQEMFHSLGREIEVVAVDDDSPDGTWRVVEAMAIPYFLEKW